MEEIKLDAFIREEIGSTNIKKIRREEFVPAIVYGGKKKTATAIKIKGREYEKIMRAHKGQSVVFHINVLEGEKKLRDYSAIVKEEQRDPLSSDLLHIDFARISLTDQIEVKVTIEVRGEAVGVKQGGGSLDHQMWEMDVVCLPTNIPEKIVIDVDELNIGDSIHVKDLPLPEGVVTKVDPEALVVSVAPPMKEEETGAEEGEEPEVLSEKKEGESSAEEASEEKSEDKQEEKAE